MSEYQRIDQFAKSLRNARRASGMRQDELALRIGVSRDLIIRMERGENVGMHYVLSAISAIGHSINISPQIPESAHVISRGFDDFYQKHFRKDLESSLKSNPDKHQGFIRPSDLKRARVVNWKQAAKI